MDDDIIAVMVLVAVLVIAVIILTVVFWPKITAKEEAPKTVTTSTPPALIVPNPAPPAPSPSVSTQPINPALPPALVQNPADPVYTFVTYKGKSPATLTKNQGKEAYKKLLTEPGFVKPKFALKSPHIMVNTTGRVLTPEQAKGECAMSPSCTGYLDRPSKAWERVKLRIAARNMNIPADRVGVMYSAQPGTSINAAAYDFLGDEAGSTYYRHKQL